MQADDLTFPKLVTAVENGISAIETLKLNSIPGGYESILQSSVVVEGDKTLLKGIELIKVLADASRRGNVADLQVLRGGMCEELQRFLKERFEVMNANLISTIMPFVNLCSTAKIEELYELVGNDLDLASLYLQFMELSKNAGAKELSLAKLVVFLTKPERIVHFTRILACTPNSADVGASVAIIS